MQRWYKDVFDHCVGGGVYLFVGFLAGVLSSWIKCLGIFLL